MIYKVFASNLNSVEKIDYFRYNSRIFADIYYSEFREIEANSKCQAVKIFSHKYRDLINKLGTHVYFYFVDEKGNIII